jgi:hypothetical protein
MKNLFRLENLDWRLMNLPMGTQKLRLFTRQAEQAGNRAPAAPQRF